MPTPLQFIITVKDNGTVVVNKFGSAVKAVSSVGGAAVGGLTTAFTGLKTILNTVTLGMGALVSSMAPFLVIFGSITAIQRTISGLGDYQRAFNSTIGIIREADGVTKSQIASLDRLNKSLAGELPFTLAEVAEGQNELVRRGQELEHLFTTLPVAAQLAVVAQVDVAKAADIAGSAVASFGLEISDFPEVADIMSTATTKSALTIISLGEALKTVGPIASKLGVTLKDTSKFFAVMADAGIKGTLAGTSFRRAIQNMIKPSNEQAAAARRLGVTFLESGDSALNMADILGQLQGKVTNMTDLLDLFSIRSLGGMSELVEENNGKLIQLSDAFDKVGGSTGRLAKDQMAGFFGAMVRARSSIDEMFVAIGQGLEPQLISLMNTVRNLANTVSTAFKSGFGRTIVDTLTNVIVKVKEFIISFELILLNGMLKVLKGIQLLAGDEMVKIFGEKSIPELIAEGILGGITNLIGVVRNTAKAIFFAFNEEVFRGLDAFRRLLVTSLTEKIKGAGTVTAAVLSTVRGQLVALGPTIQQGITDQSNGAAKAMNDLNGNVRTLTLGLSDVDFIGGMRIASEFLQNLIDKGGLAAPTIALVEAKIRELSAASRALEARPTPGPTAPLEAPGATPEQAQPEPIAQESELDRFKSQADQMAVIQEQMRATSAAMLNDMLSFQTQTLDGIGFVLEESGSRQEAALFRGNSIFRQRMFEQLKILTTVGKNTIQFEQAKNKIMFQSAAGIATGLLSLLSTESEARFKVMKGVAIAQAIIDAQAAAAAAARAAAFLGPFAAKAAGAAALGFGLARVEAIRSTSFQSQSTPTLGGGGFSAPIATPAALGSPTSTNPLVQNAGFNRIAPQININVAGFVGDEELLATKLGETIREALGDGIEFTTRG